MAATSIVDLSDSRRHIPCDPSADIVPNRLNVQVYQVTINLNFPSLHNPFECCPTVCVCASMCCVCGNSSHGRTLSDQTSRRDSKTITMRKVCSILFGIAWLFEFRIRIVVGFYFGSREDRGTGTSWVNSCSFSFWFFRNKKKIRKKKEFCVLLGLLLEGKHKRRKKS